MTRLLRHFAWFGGLAAVLGLGIAWLGLVPIAASTEHWAPAQWFLHFTMRQSVQAQAGGVKPPSMSDPLRVQRGAGAYASACANCHGAPGQAPQLFASRMIPPAPPLTDAIASWQPQELYWIVRNGIKYTAMPAWAAPGRDDEVWDVVAFLSELPQLGPLRYRQLAHGMAGAGPGEALLQTCAGCHGVDGLGRQGSAPALARQNADYLEQSLRDYATGQRASGVMQPIAQQMDETEIRRLAGIYAGMTRRAPALPAQEELAAIARGGLIARSGIPDRDIPPCAACHGLDGESTHPSYPDLAAQSADYLELQLRLFREGRHGQTRTSALMQTLTQGLSAQEAADLARYYAATGGR